MVMQQKKKESNEIPSLKEFIFPSEEIKQLVTDLEFYHQFNNQSSVKLYEKWRGKNYYKGSLTDYVELDSIKELLDMSLGKNWQYLITTIYLVNHYTTDVDMDGFHKLNPEYQDEVIELIRKGQTAHEKLTEWLKPINKKNVLDAIYDAVKISFGENEYSLFQILKFGKIESNSSEGVVLHKHILEIDNPSALVEYFKLQKETIKDCIILTFMRNKKYEFKPTVYFFFVWQNYLYVIDMGERRLNLDNTAGQRNPTRYYEKFDRIWLPVDIIFGEKKSKSTQVTIRKQKVFRRGNLFDMFKKSPEMKAWLDMFTYRILDYIQNPKKKIEFGVTTYDTIKALEDKSQKKIEKRVKVLGKRYSSFESVGDAGSYLIDSYADKITSIVPSTSDMPMIIGTSDFIEGVVKYKQRNELANTIQKLNYKDWKKNSKRVYDWFKKFVKSHRLSDIIRLALQDKEYTYLEYPHWTEKIKKPTLMSESIMKLDYDYDWHYGDEPLIISWCLNEKLYDSPCENCRKFKAKLFIEIEFKDYRQVCEFFNTEKEKLPTEFVKHFHRQNETYVGNSILDDTDPVDEISDFWFRDIQTHQMEGWKSTGGKFPDGQPFLKIIIPLCKHCVKKHGGIVPEIIITEWRCEYCNRHIVEYNQHWHVMMHEENNDKKRFKDGKKIE